MSSGESPSAESPSAAPAAVAYSEAREPEGTRFGAGVVVLVIAAVVIIAAGITAAVVVSRESASTTPPQPSTGSQVQPAAAPGGPRTGRTIPVTLLSTGSPTLTEVTVIAAPKSVDLSGGISMVPADGWKIIYQADGIVELLNKDEVDFVVQVGKVNTKDVEEQLASDIEGFSSWWGLNNVKFSEIETGTVDSDKFKTVAKQGFAGDQMSQQGSARVIGLFLGLMNPDTQLSAFAMVIAPGPDPDKFNASTDDVNAMLQSMLKSAA